MENLKEKLEGAYAVLFESNAHHTINQAGYEYHSGVALLGQIRGWETDLAKGDKRIEWSELINIIKKKVEAQKTTKSERSEQESQAEILLRALEQNSKSIVLITQRSRLIVDPKSQMCKIPSKPLKKRVMQDNKTFCPNVAYTNQPSARFFGTGFFVAEDKIATAAHVLSLLTNGIDVSDIAFVRGYVLDSPKKYAKGIIVPLSDVFVPDIPVGPGQVLACDYSAAGHDWAVTKVRPLGPSGESGTAVALSKTSMIAPGDVLYSMGHGLGLPLKVSYQGEVIRNDPSAPFFENTLTLLGGNSGSPVFNANHEVVGIYVRGTHKTEVSAKGCLIIRDEAILDQGQECQKVDAVINALKKWPK